jgi:peptide/nickel transport system permease protein
VRVVHLLVRRLIVAVPLLVLLLFITVILQVVTPGDPARAIAGPRASDETVEAVRRRYQLDDGVGSQLLSAALRAMVGDLGTSNRSGVAVTTLIAQRSAVTLSLVASGLAASLLIAVPLAVVAGRGRARARSIVDQLSLVSVSVPTYWLSLVLILLFAVQRSWFPVGGSGDGTFASWLHHLVLPTVVIVATLAPTLLRSLTESIDRVLSSEHIVTIRGAGIGESRLIRRHVLRNALPPMVSLLGLQAGNVLFGLVIVELSFGINGVGTLLFDSVRLRDFPVVQGLTLVLGVCVVLANLMADATVAVLDPKWTL